MSEYRTLWRMHDTIRTEEALTIYLNKLNMIIRIPEITDVSVITDSYTFTINRYYIVTIDPTNNNATKYVWLTTDTDPSNNIPCTIYVWPKKEDFASQVFWMIENVKKDVKPEIWYLLPSSRSKDFIKDKLLYPHQW